MSDDEKKALLGPMCWRNPANFKFLSGERASIISVKSLCSQLLEKLPLFYSTPYVEVGNSTSNIKVSRNAKSSEKIANNTERKETRDNCGKTIANHLNDWCFKNSSKIKFGLEDYEIRKSFLFCKKSHKLVRFSLGLLNCY